MESVHPQSQTHFQEFCSCLWVGAEVPVNMSRFHLGMSAVEGACQCEAWLHVNIAITLNEQKAFACQLCMRSVQVTSWRPGRRGQHHSSHCWSETFSRTPETSISEDNHTARSSFNKSSFQVKAMDTIFFSRQHTIHWIHHLLRRNLPFRWSPRSLSSVPQVTQKRRMGTKIKTVNHIKDKGLTRTLARTLDQNLSSTVTDRFNQAARPSPASNGTVSSRSSQKQTGSLQTLAWELLKVSTHFNFPQMEQRLL